MWNPSDYAHHSQGQLAWAEELRQRLYLDGVESLLDVGCGDGKITARFAKALPEGSVVGIDDSSEMIQHAATHHPPEEYPNLQFRRLDARQLDYDQQFDVLFSNAALHWVDDHSAFLRGAFRALKQNGRMTLSFGGQGNAAGILAVFEDLALELPWRSYFPNFKNPYYFFDCDSYREWLEIAGFLVDRLELVPKPLRFSNLEGLGGWIRTTWMPITHQVPESARARFVDEFLQRYAGRFPVDGSGAVTVDMVRLEISAQKKSE